MEWKFGGMAGAIILLGIILIAVLLTCVPKNNYATWDTTFSPNVNTNVSFTNNNLTVQRVVGGPTGKTTTVRSSFPKTSGKFYYEVTVSNAHATSTLDQGGLGVMDVNALGTSAVGASANGIGWGYGGVATYTNTGFTTVATPGSNTYLATGITYMIAVDIDNGWMWAGQNNTWYTNVGGIGVPQAGSHPTAAFTPSSPIYAGVTIYSLGVGTATDTFLSFTANFGANGASNFKYPVPAGFNPGLF